MSKNGGQQAVKTGNQLEAFIEVLISDRGYRFVNREEFSAMTDMEQPIYTTQYYVGEGTYGKKRVVDFILYHPIRWQQCLVIEAKWQQSGGSVDEKFPYLVLCIKKSAYDTIVVLDGDGYSKGAENWLQGQAGLGYLKHVFNMSKFQKFANDDRL